MRRELIVGVTFAALLALLLGVTLWVKEPGLFGGQGEHRLTVHFDDVSGLAVNGDVWLYGMKAGRVVAMEPDGQGGVAVELGMDVEPDLRTDAVVKIQQRSPLGGAVVAVHPGTPGSPPLPAGTRIEGRSAVDPFAGLGGLTDLVEEVRGPLVETLENARKVSADLEARSESVARNIDEFAQNARKVSDDLAQGRGTLGRLVQDDTLYRDLEAAVESLKQVAEDARRGGGTIDLLLHDRQMADDIKTGAASLRAVSERLERGEGTVGRLLQDPALYDDLAATAKDLRTLVADARDGRGLLGRLVYDTEVADRFDRISADVAQVTGQLRRGEGTLGRLIQDEELYVDLRNALKTLTRGAEDVRENAPILTFAGFLLGAF
jgi:phospholipid/cholesterol/gamma-HCH transport system substrate-binding protein